MASPTRRPNAPTRPATRPATAAPPPERLPRWIPPLVYAVVCLLLFREFVFGQANLIGLDAIASGYFARDFYTGFVRHFHRFPLWDAYVFGGVPFVEAMHGDVFYPPSLAFFFTSTAAMWGWKIVLHVFLAGIFAYLWLGELGARRISAFLGGLLYMLGADLVSLVFPGADAKIFVTALAPLAFWLTERALRRRGISDFAWLALGVALLMLTSHLQLVYFTVWGISLYAIFRVWQIWREERRGALAVRLFGSYVLAGVLGVGAAAIQFAPPYQYLKTYSRRVQTTLQAQGSDAYAYSTSYSLHPEELFSLLEPDFVGDNAPTEVKTGATYWGRNPLKYNLEYAGLIPLLLAPLVFLRRRRPRDWFFCGLGAAALLYALGATTPVFHLFYLIPGVKLFRAPSLIIFLYAISVVTLGTFGFERYLDWARGGGSNVAEAAADRRAARVYLWSAAGVLVLLALLMQSGALVSFWQAAVFRGMNPGQLQALEGNLPAMQGGFWIVAIMAVVLAGAWEIVAAGMMQWRGALITVALLGALDLYRIDRPFVRATELADQSPDAATLFQPSDVVDFLRGRQAAGEVFRALDLGTGGMDQNWLAVHGIEQLGGHHPNEIGRYRDLLGGEQPTNMVPSEFRLLNLTNTAYVVSPQPVALQFPVAFQGTAGVVYRNPAVLPRAFLVGRTEVVPDAEAVQRVLARDFDMAHVAALPEALPPGLNLGADPKGTVAWKSREANQLSLAVHTDVPALLVVTDNYYDAWRGEVDGRPAPILRADYTFRAIPIPAGAHSVRMYYQSSLISGSAATSAVLLAVLLAGALGGAYLRRRRTTA